MDRRGYVKYAAAGVVMVAAGVAGYRMYKTQTPTPTWTGGPTPGEMATVTSPVGVNHPPRFEYPSMDVKPKCILPTPECVVEFAPRVVDPDGDPLSFVWYVDGREVGRENKYSTKLSEGEHKIGLRVSDGKSDVYSEKVLEVEPEQIYPTKQLNVKYKGVSYFVGSITPEWPTIPIPSKEEMDEQLDTIREELGCNAVIISAGRGYEDNMIECGKMAVEKGFERIYIQPRYMGASPEETVDLIGEFAGEVKILNELALENGVPESVVYCVGHEFALETNMVEGIDWFKRLESLKKGKGWDEVRRVFPKMFRDIIAICRENYGHKISYAAIAYGEIDVVPWENPIFESIGVDAYIQEGIGWTEDWILNLLSRLKKYNKPIQSMEAGCFTIKGAGKIAGLAPVTTNPYDEDEQSNYIRKYCKMLNKARIDGYFYTQYNDNWDKGYGLYHPITKKRKKGFYMYKSYSIKR
ncbi:MAG: hypothetical protein QW542_04990 [Thermoproteota archaeon]